MLWSLLPHNDVTVWFALLADISPNALTEKENLLIIPSDRFLSDTESSGNAVFNITLLLNT